MRKFKFSVSIILIEILAVIATLVYSISPLYIVVSGSNLESILTVLLLLSLGLIMGLISDGISVLIQSSAVRYTQEKIWYRLFNQPVEFFKQTRFKDLLGFASTAQLVRGVFLRVCLQTIPSVVTTVIVFIVILLIDLPTGLVLVLMGGGCSAIIIFATVRQIFYDRAVLDSVDKAEASLYIAFLHIEEIHFWGMRKLFFMRWKDIFGGQKSKDKSSRFWSDIVQLIARSGPAICVATALVFYASYGGSPTSLILLVIGFFQLLQLLLLIVGIVPAMVMAVISWKRLNKLKDNVKENYQQHQNSHRYVRAGGSSLLVNNLTYAYCGGEIIINSVSLAVNPGEIVAIVGDSGAGKSTLLYLLAGLLDPISGTIYADEENIHHLRNSDLRSRIVLVHQHSRIQRGSLREQFTRLNPSITDQNIFDALRAVHLDEFLSNLPLGLATPLNDRSSGISNGERQRILLATHIALNPAILLLDEPTSNLDADTQELIIDCLRNAGITIILTTHRFAVAAHADSVYGLKDGTLDRDIGKSWLLDNSLDHSNNFI